MSSSDEIAKILVFFSVYKMQILQPDI